MAEAQSSGDKDGGEAENSWWGSWINAAKEKTASALGMVSKDLAEFTCTLKSDATRVVAHTSETLKESLKAENTAAATNKVRHHLSNFMGGISRALTVPPDDSDQEPITKRTQEELFDRAKTRLRVMQVDPGTYLEKPSGPSEHYANWLKSFDLEHKKGEISELLVTMVEVRSLYTKLVPSEVSHADFWRHYFYRVHQLDLDEARKQALMKRAENVQKKEDSISWDDDEEEGVEDNCEPIDILQVNPTESSQDSNESRLRVIQEECSQNNQTVIPEVVSLEPESSPSNSNILNQSKPVVQSESLQQLPRKDFSDQPSSSKQSPVKNTSNVNVSDEQQTQPSGSYSEQKITTPGEKDLSVDKNIVQVEKETPAAPVVNIVPVANSSENLVDAENISAKDDTIENSNNSSSTGLETNRSSDLSQYPSSAADQSDNCITDAGQVQVTPRLETPMENDKTKAGEPVSHGENYSVLEKEIKTKVKGDIVVVGSDRTSPSSDSSEQKEFEWEKDFDVDLTEEDIKAAEEIAKKLNISAADYTKIAGEEEDWESWE
ncbi:hypothetical protein ACJMK2_041418 [Sinanodonta woodiana]|uniref:BSD domain-containing protein n=1 Tax=Sinanodonta woodiana TaxID=1069815 RepID=A0ABD3W7B7_SINWO